MSIITSNLLGIESKPKTMKENIPNILAALGTDLFTNPRYLKEIRKFRLKPEDEHKLIQALTAVGMSLVRNSLTPALLRVIENKEKIPDIYDAIVLDTLNTFAQLMIADGMSPVTFGNWHKSIMEPLDKGITHAIQNPEEIWGENEHGGLPIDGIIGIILQKVFGEQNLRKLVLTDLHIGLDTFMLVQNHFDNFFIASWESLLKGDMANIIDNMLRSPMGRQYGIS